jgi:glycosyltransferase involved in cell wall biosynthesis
MGANAASSEKKKDRKCLMISYYFPPGGGVGVIRSLKYVQYLPVSGWKPVVLTTFDPLGIPRDEALLEQVADAKIYRVSPLFSTKYCFYSDRSFLPRLICASLLIPDAVVPWVLPAVRKGLEIIKEEDIDLIYSTSPPASSHLAAAHLKRKTGLPWVADFRDAWLSDPDRNNNLHNRIRSATVEKLQERWVVENADRIITVSEPIKEDLLNRYPSLRAENVIIIENGFDPIDFRDLDKKSLNKFTFTITGSFSKQHRDPAPLIDGVQELLKEQAQLIQEFQILLVGPYKSEQADLVSRYGLKDVVHFIGPVSYKESLTYQISSDVNVFLYVGPSDRRSNQMMSGKLFEYLGAGKPILVITNPDTSAAQLVKNIKVGEAVNPHDPQEIAKALSGFIKRKGEKLNLTEELLPYQRSFLTKKLAESFDTLCNKVEK